MDGPMDEKSPALRFRDYPGRVLYLLVALVVLAIGVALYLAGMSNGWRIAPYLIILPIFGVLATLNALWMIVFCKPYCEILPEGVFVRLTDTTQIPWSEITDIDIV